MAEVGELAAKIFDRLPQQFPDGVIVDALLLVEVSDPSDLMETDDTTEQMVPATVVLAECTNNRVTVQRGIIDFAERHLDGEE